jgi:hypothetical protein
MWIPAQAFNEFGELGLVLFYQGQSFVTELPTFWHTP